MNMFKKKNKVRDDDALASLPSESGTGFKSSRGMTKKKKKIEVEERPVFNLDSALPKTDDFRTSLIMPTLSTRFSMLREQDDPNTKVGKASDDSVLFPKRASRLNLFSHNQLSDIAEVEPVPATFKPPFADDGRKGSISDGYASDDGGSIMNRTRPSEGNNLFGGRQKLYQVPSSSAKDLHSASGMTTGKHTYASDVSISPFQQMRLMEKELAHVESEEVPDQEGLHVEADDLDVTQSSLNSFSKNRGTQSSTNSGPSNQRTSTAATSLVSESPVTRQSSNGTVAKARELDTNSSVESIGFSASPNLRKKRDETGRSAFRLSQSKSAANLRETYSRPAPTMSPPVFRGMSPPLNTASQSQDFVPQDQGRKAFGSPRFQTASPALPIKSESEDAFTNSLQPSDRGKATAMGLFHKPQKKYDEQQFQQRQRQMHEGRHSPYAVDSRSESRSSSDLNKTDMHSVSSPPAAASPKPQDHTQAPQMPPIPNGTQSPIFNSHAAPSSSAPKSFSRPRTKSATSTREATVKARVESLIKRQNAELAALEAAQLGPTRSRTAIDYPEASQEEDVQQRTFFDNSDASDDERQSRQQSIKSTVSRVLAPTDIHPALRDGIHDFDFETQSSRGSNQPRQSNYSTNSKVDPALNRQEKPDHESILSLDDVDSPTLGPSGLGLSGLIRTHLRNDSDRSSVMRPQSSLVPPQPDTRITSTASDPRTATESIKSDPFELENHQNNENEPSPITAETMPPAVNLSQKATEILGIATAIKNASEQAAPKPPVTKFEDISHHRNESTETQREQQRFDQDLAERRRKIQDQLRSVQERSRSRSPIGERVTTPNASHGFMGRLPGKTSPGESQGPSKAMKMLGISGQARDTTQASSRPPRNMWTPEYDRRPDMSSRQDYRASPTQDIDHYGGRYTPNGRPPVRAWTSNENADRPRPPRSTTPSGRQNRHRANSAAADRVPSRNRQHPVNDFEPPMPGRFPGSPNKTSPPPRAPERRTDSPGGRRPSDQRSGSASGQRRDKVGYASPDMFVPPHNGSGFLSRELPRPSPSPMESPRQAPISMPLSPPLSALHSPNPASASNGRTTPTIPGRAAPAGARKRSIVKGMISDPTFVSSTSSVPLVNLPQNGGPPVEPMFVPPVPAMNPRRRGNMQVDSEFSPHPAVRPTGNNLMPMSETKDQGNMLASTAQSAFDHVLPPSNQSRFRHRLRKSSSEGGNMAARARQQALAEEMAREKDRSPHVAVFPNRSATTLIPQDGGMF